MAHLNLSLVDQLGDGQEGLGVRGQPQTEAEHAAPRHLGEGAERMNYVQLTAIKCSFSEAKRERKIFKKSI